MILNIEYNEDDFIHSYREYLFTTKMLKKRDVYFVLPIVFIFLILYTVFYGFDPIMLVLGLLELIFLIIVLNILILKPKKKYKKLLDEGHEHTSVLINEKGINMKYTDKTDKFQWNGFNDAYESESFIYFAHITTQSYLFFKKSDIDSENLENIKRYFLKGNKKVLKFKKI